MKKTIATIAAFLVGTVLGFLVALTVLQWLAFPVGGGLIVLSPTEPIAVRIRFGVGCGLLFAAAVFLSNSLRSFLLYLLTGLIVSLGVTVLQWGIYSSSSEIVPVGTFVSLQALPALRIPLVGTIAILVLASVRYLLARGAKVPSGSHE